MARPLILLVVLMGLPGAGKSTLARALCRGAGLTRVDRDALRAHLFPRGRATPAEKAAANAAVWRRVRLLLRQRRSVLVDGMTFADRAQRRQAQRIARSCGAACLPLWLDVPVAVARQRIAGTAYHPAPDRTPALVDAVARRFAPVGRRVIRLDGRLPPRALLRRARHALGGAR